MKVITLKNIKKFIENKHGEQTISRIGIKGDTIQSGIYIIHDKGTVCPEAYLNSNDELEFNNEHDKIHCILLESDIEDFNSEHPFIKSREALSGKLVIDNKVPTEEELKGYWLIITNHH